MTPLVSVLDQIFPTWLQWLQLSASDCGFFFFPVQKLSDDTFIPNRAKRRHARPHMLDSDDDDDDDGDKRKEAYTKEETSDQPHQGLMTDDPQSLVKT